MISGAPQVAKFFVAIRSERATLHCDGDIGMRRWVAPFLIFCGLVSCAAPADREAAIAQVVAQGFLRPGPTPGSFLFGIGLLSQGQVSEGQSCAGAIGSVLPPFFLNQCFAGAIIAPLLPLAELQMALNGMKSNPYRRHVYLDGIENYWVPQSDLNNCWAATIEIARKYLHLRYVSQNDLLASAQKVCPEVSRQTGGADAYQIVSVIRNRLYQYDARTTMPGICFHLDCVVQKLIQHRPIIMLGAGHAVLLVGADYLDMTRGHRGNGPSYLVEKIYVLDPDSASNGRVQERSILDFCKADIFMFY
jgi:hypothetical protein